MFARKIQVFDDIKIGVNALSDLFIFEIFWRSGCDTPPRLRVFRFREITVKSDAVIRISVDSDHAECVSSCVHYVAGEIVIYAYRRLINDIALATLKLVVTVGEF